MFVNPFIRRPLLASVRWLVIILAGLIAVPSTPLEQAINGAEGMLYMSSSSSSSGVATITVTFDVTRDQDLAQVDVQNRVSTALGRLPTEVRQLGVTVNKQQTGFVMAAGVYA